MKREIIIDGPVTKANFSCKYCRFFDHEKSSCIFPDVHCGQIDDDISEKPNRIEVSKNGSQD